MTSALRALRPEQWVKNLLVFAPLVLAHQSAVEKLFAAALAFVAFCAASSAGYVVNDLRDLDADRRHPQKSRRPFASGTLPTAWGPPMALGLLAGALLISVLTLPWAFLGALAAYLLLNSAYSFWLKRKVLIDVLTLAALYTLRILAGGAAADVFVSEWLMAFSVFLFLSLAFAKRYVELARLADQSQSAPAGRGYQVSDLRLIESIGPTSGYLAVLVLALYVSSAAMRQFYSNSWALWLICPLLLYWISRVWIHATRKTLAEDPLVFALKDRVSWLVGLLTIVLFVIAGWS